MFLKVYLLFSKIILVALSYLIIAPFYNLYYQETIDLNSIIYILFSGLFIKAVLDYHVHRGYIETLYSHKTVPSNYGKVRKYFRKIFNLGFVNVIILISQIFILIFYPVINGFINNKNNVFSESTIIISTSFLLVYCVISIALFIPGFFKLTIAEYESKNNIDKMNDFQELEFDKEKEREILMGLLKSSGIDLVNYPFKISNGKVNINMFVTDKLEGWFNINIENPQGNPMEIRKSVENNSVRMLRVFQELDTDINSFVLSYHIYLQHESKSRNVFIRTNKMEINDVLTMSQDSSEVIELLDNKLFNDLFYK